MTAVGHGSMLENRKEGSLVSGTTYRSGMMMGTVQVGNSRCLLVTFNLGFCDLRSGVGSGLSQSPSDLQCLPSLTVSKAWDIFWQVCVSGGSIKLLH